MLLLLLIGADLAGVAAAGAAVATVLPVVVAAPTVTAASAAALAAAAVAAAAELVVGLAGLAEGVCSGDSEHPAHSSCRVDSTVAPAPLPTPPSPTSPLVAYPSPSSSLAESASFLIVTGAHRCIVEDHREFRATEGSTEVAPLVF